MSIETEEVAKTVERGNDLVVETAQTLVDCAYLAQRQTLDLSRAILQSMEAGQRANREIAEKLVRQTLQGQALWWQFFQESARLTVDVFARATEAGLAGTREQVRTGTDRAATEKRPVAAGK